MVKETERWWLLQINSDEGIVWLSEHLVKDVVWVKLDHILWTKYFLCPLAALPQLWTASFTWC